MSFSPLEWMLWGGVIDADSSLAHAILAPPYQYSMMALSGGISEQVRTQNGHHLVYIKRRKGIFKLALQYGVPLVPCYCFGETDVLTTYSFAQSLRNALADKLRFPLCLFTGRRSLHAPHKIPLNVYVGNPISTIQTPRYVTKNVMSLSTCRSIVVCTYSYTMFDISYSHYTVLQQMKYSIYKTDTFKRSLRSSTNIKKRTNALIKHFKFYNK